MKYDVEQEIEEHWYPVGAKRLDSDSAAKAVAQTARTEGLTELGPPTAREADMSCSECRRGDSRSHSGSCDRPKTAGSDEKRGAALRSQLSLLVRRGLPWSRTSECELRRPLRAKLVLGPRVGPRH
jgi:hypothetical protein